MVWVLTGGSGGSLDESIAVAGQRDEAGEEMASPVDALVQPEAFHPAQSPRSPRLLAKTIAAKTDEQLLAEFAAGEGADNDVNTLSAQERKALAAELRQCEAMAASLEARNSVNN